VNGILKSNGTTLSAAIADTDYDSSITNEFNTIQGDDNTATTGLAISIDGAGIVTTDVVGDILTITGTEADTLDTVSDRGSTTDQAITTGGVTATTGTHITVGTTQWNSADEFDGTKIKDADYGDVTIDAAGDWDVENAQTVATITGLAPDTQNTYARTQYLIPYASTTTAFGEIAIGTDGQVLTSAGAGVAPSFEKYCKCRYNYINNEYSFKFFSNSGKWSLSCI